jgi:hypothetical protein
VNSVVNGIVNAVSQGKVEENRKNLGYDQIFHLFLVITLKDGYKFLIERNESVNISNGDLNRGEQISVPVNKQITLNEFVDKGSAGDSDFWKYDPVNRNCQHFCRDMLQKNGMLTPEASTFILQDAVKLLESSPQATKFSRGVTDFAQRLHIILHGANKYRRKRYNHG